MGNYNPIEVSQAASKARAELEKSGAVGRTETIQKAILPEMVVTTEDYTAEFGVNGAFMLPAFALEEGKHYKIVADGYTLDYIGEPYDAKIIGNKAIAELGDDTGEPWVVVSYPSQGVYAVGFADPAESNKSHTVTVYEVTETIHPIDPKFLPGVCLPVVELSEETLGSLFSGGTATATEAEAAVIVAAANTLTPLVARGRMANSMAFASVGDCVDEGTGILVYTFTIADSKLTAAVTGETVVFTLA